MQENELLEYTHEWLRYEPETGKFFWKKSAPKGQRQTGKETATSNSHGYKNIKLNGKLYRAHRIAFLIMKQRLPFVIDHIDRNRANNKWDNLREVSHKENCFNRSVDTRNKTGITGVYFNPKEKVYTVTHGKKYLGRSKSIFEAACLRKSAEYNKEINA